MKQISLITYDYLLQNKIFDKKINETKFDLRNSRWIYLKEELKKKGFNINTYDIISPQSADIVLVTDFIKNIPKHKNLQLILIEPPSVIKKIYNSNYIKKFNKIFTWDDSLVDDEKFYKYFFSYNKFFFELDEKLFFRKQFVMMASNKFSYHKDELYSKRLEIIDWFEKNDEYDFDLYGFGWEKIVFKNKILRPLNKFSFKNKLNNYKGKSINKILTLKSYKFNFCLENINNIQGYITEKIFDSFFSGTIPIYDGASNINKFIDEAIIINLKDFQNINEVVKYTTNLTKNQYMDKVEKIDEFLKYKYDKFFDLSINAKKMAELIVK